MALVTRVVVRLMRAPETVKTALAIYDRTEDAGDTVAEITARAIVPTALEMLDGVMLRMVEEATHAGYPLDAEAILLVEVDGPEAGLADDVRVIDSVRCARLSQHPCSEVRFRSEIRKCWVITSVPDLIPYLITSLRPTFNITSTVNHTSRPRYRS